MKLLNVDKRLELYYEYWQELSEYDSEMKKYTKEFVSDIALDYMVDIYAEWIDIYCDGKTVGFFIICSKENEQDCHPDTDYTISQAYINRFDKKGSGCVLAEWIQRHWP